MLYVKKDETVDKWAGLLITAASLKLRAGTKTLDIEKEETLIKIL